jgi:hypothetical protein
MYKNFLVLLIIYISLIPIQVMSSELWTSSINRLGAMFPNVPERLDVATSSGVGIAYQVRIPAKLITDSGFS